jgi:hypothetical protein
VPKPFTPLSSIIEDWTTIRNLIIVRDKVQSAAQNHRLYASPPHPNIRLLRELISGSKDNRSLPPRHCGAHALPRHALRCAHVRLSRSLLSSPESCKHF